MQQTPSQNTRSAARPMIWLTIAFHLALGAFLYLKTTSSEPESRQAATIKTEKQEKP